MPPIRGHRFFIHMIQFNHVSFAYGRDHSVPIVRDISIAVNTGESLAIMGGNGCGKTTLGLLLCGVLTPDAGTISIDGRQITEIDGAPPIGFLFQDPDNGLVATTVEREVAFSLENRNTPPAEIKKSVDNIISKFNLDHFRQRLVWNLSGGEKQRLSLAALFVTTPEILFLDEPASFLDWPGACRLEKTMQEVKAAYPNVTIIRVTQYLSVAEKFPRVLLMRQGEIISDGSPQTVLSDSAKLKSTGLRPLYRHLTPKPVTEVTAAPSPKPRNAGPVITVENVTFAYDSAPEIPVFDNLSLAVNRGKVLGLAGATGCGKSTLAQMICGIYRPDKGAVRFERDGARAVMSFQQPERQFFLDTVFDEVAYGIRSQFADLNALTDVVRRSMTTVGLDFDHFRSRDPHTLSGGEARRLAFAIAIALASDLIIFDEPTCGLDEAGVNAFKTLVHNLQNDDKTIIIISHNSDILADLCDRIALLSGGKIGRIVTPLEFFSSAESKELLPVPEIIVYQQATLGKVVTVHPADLFDLSAFSS